MRGSLVRAPYGAGAAEIWDEKGVERELGVRGTVVMDGFWTGADYIDYTEMERREDGAPMEAWLRPMR